MKPSLRSLFFFLPFIASVQAKSPDFFTAHPLPDKAFTLTESLVTLGLLAISQRAWQPFLFNQEKGAGSKPDDSKVLHVSSDYPFIVSGSEPVPDQHTLCQLIDTPENRAWQCFGLKSIASVALNTRQPLYLETRLHQGIVLRYAHEPGLTFPEYDPPDYLNSFAQQQTKMERIHKTAAERKAMGMLKIVGKTDNNLAHKLYIARTKGITVEEQDEIEKKRKRLHEGACDQSYRSSIEPDIHLLIDTELCLAESKEACREILSKIVTCPNSETDTSSESTSTTPQEGGGAPEGCQRKDPPQQIRYVVVDQNGIVTQSDKIEKYQLPNNRVGVPPAKKTKHKNDPVCDNNPPATSGSQNPHKCDYEGCGKCFKTSWHLRRHKRVHSGEKPFECTQCGKCFARADTLEAHESVHSGEKPYKCEQCGKCFARAGALRKHERVHSGEKPYECKQCSKCFARADALEAHERVHSGKKPYECEHCEWCFTTAGNLRRHERVHTGEKPYECEQCGKYFSEAGNLKAHKRLHSGEKPYKCERCEQCFTYSRSLNKHMRLHEGPEPEGDNNVNNNGDDEQSCDAPASSQ